MSDPELLIDLCDCSIDEPAACADCGTVTAPRDVMSGSDWYVVHDTIWRSAGMASGCGYLCVPCLEHRIGRSLCARDFTDAPINAPMPWDTPRLAAAKTRELMDDTQ